MNKALPTLLILTMLAGVQLSLSTGSQSNCYPINNTGDIVLVDTIPPTSDTILTYIVDDYPITNEMLEEYSALQRGDIVWFRNRALNESLVIELYTDWHRFVTYHFFTDDIPDAVIDRMQVFYGLEENASRESKRKYLISQAHAANEIDISYFTSNKGFQLGDRKEQALMMYGTPDQTAMEEGIEILKWHFAGEILYDGKIDLKGKPLAKDSFGHEVIMFFRQDALVAMILFNDIP